ncbi:hypothetical protein CCHR01_01002 [Colletotrichum chrysophilum]|uniref:Uncharacterized protein n=1 Tax=Colletotrichum chrysophilum TaxID=1836956 RepID=A0AAD9AXR1_9PEZI|nr:hypothetical protein CCHR01_01002 [Colletotrichum chrysophilum]
MSLSDHGLNLAVDLSNRKLGQRLAHQPASTTSYNVPPPHTRDGSVVKSASLDGISCSPGSPLRPLRPGKTWNLVVCFMQALSQTFFATLKGLPVCRHSKSTNDIDTTHSAINGPGQRSGYPHCRSEDRADENWDLVWSFSINLLALLFGATRRDAAHDGQLGIDSEDRSLDSGPMTDELAVYEELTEATQGTNPTPCHSQSGTSLLPLQPHVTQPKRSSPNDNKAAVSRGPGQETRLAGAAQKRKGKHTILPPKDADLSRLNSTNVTCKE